jgi:flagellar biosynthesis GTPase FlhF
VSFPFLARFRATPKPGFRAKPLGQRGYHQIHYKKKAQKKETSDASSPPSEEANRKSPLNSAAQPPSVVDSEAQLQKQLAQVQQLQQQQIASQQKSSSPSTKEVTQLAMPTPVLMKAGERFLDICWKDFSGSVSSAGHKKFQYVLEMRFEAATISRDRKAASVEPKMSIVYIGDDLSYRVSTVQPGTQYKFSVRVEGPFFRWPGSPLLSCSTPGVTPSTEHPPIKSNIDIEAEAKRERELKEQQAKQEKAKAAEQKRKAAAEKAEREAAQRKAREKELADKKAEEDAAYEREKQRIIAELEARRVQEAQEVLQLAAIVKREKEAKLAAEAQAKLEQQARERERQLEVQRLEAERAREAVHV